MFCPVCKDYPNIADQSSPLFAGCGGDTYFRHRILKTHGSSKEHIFCVTRKENEQHPDQAPIQRVINRLTKESEGQMSALVTIAYVVASENMAFTKFTPLCKMQKKLGTDLGQLYQNEKACRAFVTSIAGVEEDTIISDIQKARFFTVLADGSTDSSIVEQESVFVRFMGENGQPQTRLAAMVALESANSDGVTKAILDGLYSIGVSEQDIKTKLVGCNFDGASVMMGRKNCVFVKLAHMVDHQFISIHCVAHNLELGAMDCVKSVPYLDTFNSTIQSVFKFY